MPIRGMRSTRDPRSLGGPPFALALVGKAIDDRGVRSIAYAQTRTPKSVVVSYDPDQIALVLDGLPSSQDALKELLLSTVGPVLIEATTLGFVEVFLALRAAKDAGRDTIWILYTEPVAYRVHRRSHVLHRRDFALTTEVRDFAAVPGATLLLDFRETTRGVFFLGYEGERLQQLFEQTNLRPSDCSVVMGVPAFNAGWEMDTFANNVRSIKELRVPELLYAAAQSPLSAYTTLERSYAAKADSERLLVGPIGTKPHGIGAATFACDHDDVGLVYDNPVKSQGRTTKYSTWHLFEIGLK
jgi:hypothetical protein